MKKTKEAEPVEEVAPDFVTPLDVTGNADSAPLVVPEVVPVLSKAELIASHFGEVGDIDGEPFDPKNKDHIIVAAYLVGAGKLLRRL